MRFQSYGAAGVWRGRSLLSLQLDLPNTHKDSLETHNNSLLWTQATVNDIEEVLVCPVWLYHSILCRPLSAGDRSEPCGPKLKASTSRSDVLEVW